MEDYPRDLTEFEARFANEGATGLAGRPCMPLARL